MLGAVLVGLRQQECRGTGSLLAEPGRPAKSVPFCCRVSLRFLSARLLEKDSTTHQSLYLHTGPIYWGCGVKDEKRVRLFSLHLRLYECLYRSRTSMSLHDGVRQNHAKKGKSIFSEVRRGDPRFTSPSSPSSAHRGLVRSR